MAKRRRGAGELTLAAGKPPKQVRTSPRELTKDRMARFFEALGASCNVRHAADAAKVSTSAVYKRRQVDAEFRARWAAAVHEGYVRLELALLERALIGSGEAPDTARAEGEGDASLRALPPSVLLAMLKMHRDVAREGAPGQSSDSEEQAEQLRERIANKLERLRKQIEARG